MFNRNKKKFVSRGVYFMSTGKLKGSYVLHLPEEDTEVNRTLMAFPDKDVITMTDDEIKLAFESGTFEYVKRIPKKIYKVCLAEFKLGRSE